MHRPSCGGRIESRWAYHSCGTFHYPRCRIEKSTYQKYKRGINLSKKKRNPCCKQQAEYVLSCIVRSARNKTSFFLAVEIQEIQVARFRPISMHSFMAYRYRKLNMCWLSFMKNETPLSSHKTISFYYYIKIIKTGLQRTGTGFGLDLLCLVSSAAETRVRRHAKQNQPLALHTSDLPARVSSPRPPRASPCWNGMRQSPFSPAPLP